MSLSNFCKRAPVVLACFALLSLLGWGCQPAPQKADFLKEADGKQTLQAQSLLGENATLLLRNDLTNEELEISGQQVVDVLTQLDALPVTVPSPNPTQAPGFLWGISKKGDTGVRIFVENTTRLSIVTAEGSYYLIVSEKDGRALNDGLKKVFETGSKK